MFYIPREKKYNDYELSDLKALGTICPKLKTLDIHFYDPSWSEILSEMVCGCHRVNRFACTTPLSNAALHHVARLPNLEKLRIYTHHLWSLPLPETATAPYFNIRGSLGEYSTTGDNDVFLLPIAPLREPRITIHGLARLFKGCRNLRILYLAIDATFVDPLPKELTGPSVQNTFIDTLYLVDSLVSHPTAVAGLLQKFLPCLHDVHNRSSSLETDLDYLSTHAVVWKKVSMRCEENIAMQKITEISRSTRNASPCNAVVGHDQDDMSETTRVRNRVRYLCMTYVITSIILMNVSELVGGSIGVNEPEM